MTVKGSPITIEVDGTDAPITAGNFVDLVERGFYNGLAFHRVVRDPQPFVVQGGDPKGNGTGGFTDPKTQKSRYIPLEIKLQPESKDKAGEIIYGKALGQQAGFSDPPVVLNHKRGAVAMARSQMPDSASSQFYFALSDLQFLDGDYAVFGYVTKGMDVVDKIQQGDRIQSAKVVSGSENLKR
jgi:peptidyl-prolyl cis-trans isomerase B (cyclophilin B)